MAEPRLDDAAVGERLGRLDELLGRLEQTPGPLARLGLDAVSELAALYGEALARCLDHAAAVPRVSSAFAADELVGHLLVLHDLHPEPVGRRVARAVHELAPEVAERGGSVELVGVEAGVATVRLATGGGCGSTGAALADAVREAVLAIAPELTEVRCVAPPRQPAFVPLDTLLHPVASAGPRA
jgi:Fe-S cluster biogenesis protein NfuA